MKWILYLFLLLIAFASIGLWYLQDPGSIKIIWLGFEVQLSVVVGFCILLSLTVLILLLKTCLSWLLGIPLRWTSFFQKARDKKASHELLDFYTTFEAENFNTALQSQKKASKLLTKNPFFLWISGNLFEKTNNPLEAEKYFIELSQLPSASFLGLKGQISAALHQRDSKRAYVLLERAETLMPSSPWVLNHLKNAAIDQKKFKKAKEVILRLEDLGYTPSDISKKQIAALLYHQTMQAEMSPSKKEDFLKQSHGLDPSLQEATSAFADLLANQGRKRDALHVIETTWVIAPSQSLGDLYLKIFTPKNDLDGYQAASQLIRHNSKSKESLLLLARTALKAHLWGEARAALSSLVKQDPSVEIYHLFATLELEENKNPKAAIDWLEEGMKTAENSLSLRDFKK